VVGQVCSSPGSERKLTSLGTSRNEHQVSSTSLRHSSCSWGSYQVSYRSSCSSYRQRRKFLVVNVEKQSHQLTSVLSVRHLSVRTRLISLLSFSSSSWEIRKPTTVSRGLPLSTSPSLFLLKFSSVRIRFLATLLMRFLILTVCYGLYLEQPRSLRTRKESNNTAQTVSFSRLPLLIPSEQPY
jgi:hypothetical protein